MHTTAIAVPVAALRRAVADGLTMPQLANHFGVSICTVRKWLRANGLTAKRGSQEPAPDPTPEEIEQRAAECRLRHLAAMLRETPEETEARLVKNRR